MADDGGDFTDFIPKTCEDFSFHVKFTLNLRPEQRQAVEALFQGRDILTV